MSRAFRAGVWLASMSLIVAASSTTAAAAPTPADPDLPPLSPDASYGGFVTAAEPQHQLRTARTGEVSVAAAPENPPASLGNDRYLCTYDVANWWTATWDESASGTWTRDSTGRFDHFGSLDLRDTGLIGGVSRASYSAEIGHALVFNGDGYVRAEVGFPWSYKGNVDLLSQFSAAGGFSRSTIDMRFLVDLMRDDLSSALEVDGFTVTASRGVPGEFDDVSNNDFHTRTVSVVGFGEILRSAFRVEADLETETVPLSNARAAFDFTQGDGRGWKTGASQRWTITMKPGFVLVDCG